MTDTLNMPVRRECKIALVISTRNRARHLPWMLEALKKLECRSSWEIVLVDNGSTDNTPSLLAEFQHSMGNRKPVRVVSEPEPGLARARNRGAAATNAEILAFTDDDCYPNQDFLDAIVAQFEAHAIAYLGGRVLLHDPRDLRITILERNRPAEFPPRSFIEAGTIHGANFAVRRKAFMATGGFNEHLGAGTPFQSGEDTELVARLSWDGQPGRYDPGPVVSHHHRRRDPAAQKRLMRGYDRGRGAYMLLFCLRRDSRRLYARRWLSVLGDGAVGRFTRELWAAACYLSRYGVRCPAQIADQDSRR